MGERIQRQRKYGKDMATEEWCKEGVMADKYR
jgi:hypothetical protein